MCRVGVSAAKRRTGYGRLSIMNTRRAWGWLLFDGILGILAGIVALAWPGVTVLALAVVLGIGLLFQGSLQVSAGSRAMSGTPGRGWLIFFGALSILGGVICLVHPGAGVFAIILGITIWFVAAGVNELVAGFTLKEHRAWNLILGVLTLIAALILIAQPGLAIGTVAFLTGLFFLIRGAGEIALAMRLRQTHA
jgi:uncharacterized membrane protein HdeD (DUF308 family)